MVNMVAEQMVGKLNVHLLPEIRFMLKYPDVPEVNASLAPKAEVGMKPFGHLQAIGFLLPDGVTQKFINRYYRSSFHKLHLA